MDKRTSPAVFVGGASLLTIFAVLCLAVFALLSVSTARSSERIAQTSRQAITDYYAADRQAQAILARLRNGETVDGVQQQDGICTYRCPISPTTALDVVVKLNGSEYEILHYQTISTGTWTPDDTLPVWNGE